MLQGLDQRSETNSHEASQEYGEDANLLLRLHVQLPDGRNGQVQEVEIEHDVRDALADRKAGILRTIAQPVRVLPRLPGPRAAEHEGGCDGGESKERGERDAGVDHVSEFAVGPE